MLQELALLLMEMQFPFPFPRLSRATDVFIQTTVDPMPAADVPI